MKKSILNLLPLAGILLLASCDNNGANSNNDNTDTTVVVHTDTNVVINHDYETERNTYRTDLSRKIDSLKMEINARDSVYNNKASKTNSKVKQDWQNTKADLNRQIDSLKADLNRAGDKSENDWQEFKGKVNAQWDSVQTDWRTFKDKHLDKDNNPNR